jgi:hypothetical protein
MPVQCNLSYSMPGACCRVPVPPPVALTRDSASLGLPGQGWPGQSMYGGTVLMSYSGAFTKVDEHNPRSFGDDDLPSVTLLAV